MSVSIRIDDLSKRYQLGLTHASSLRDLANATARRFLRRQSGGARPGDGDAGAPAGRENSFWALKDINLTVREGDTVGIIGHNGAGKSTLLKILSRITCPTTGRIELTGRVASLLEVGTGFHPELTGRENIFLNGTILGMTRSEVGRQLDAIVQFAGVEKFLDTPVKRYSSGMKVRLGFAVAAHLEPEILIVDEVLAVGDMDFQRKCIDKMDDVAKSGRTILFVSHNMAIVSQLCKTGVVLAGGVTEGAMPISDAIDLYMKQASQGNRDGHFSTAIDDGTLGIRSIQVSQENTDVGSVRHDNAFDVRFHIVGPRDDQNLQLSIAVCDRFQKKVFTAISEIPASERPDSSSDAIRRVLRIRKRFLMPGRYSVIAGLLDSQGRIKDHHRFVCPFTIENVGDDPILSGGGDYGVVFGECEWVSDS